MAYNNYIYTVCPNDPDCIAERTSAGFSGGNFSTDGTMVVGDRGSSDPYLCDEYPAKPSYWEGNWPHLSHEEVLQLIAVEASAEGASDGWGYTDPEVI